MSLVNIPVRAEFDDPQGSFAQFGTYDTAQQNQLRAQNHVTIRSFYNDAILALLTMLYIDRLDMTTMDGMTMTNLASESTVGYYNLHPGEAWTGSVTVGKQSDRNHHRGLTLACTAGINTTESVLRS